MIEGGIVYYVRTDHIGRPVFATNSSGTKVWTAAYLPFGGVHTSTGTLPSARFPGQWFQSESGLHQNWMRDYDPTTGRYLQADPLGLVDGASVYGYVGQNPGRFIDPKGENALLLLCAGPQGVLICGGGGLLLIGAAVTANYICPDLFDFNFDFRLPPFLLNEADDGRGSTSDDSPGSGHNGPPNGPSTGNSALDEALGGSAPSDEGQMGWETPKSREDFDREIGGVKGAEQITRPEGATTTTFPDGTSVTTYPGRSSTGSPGWSVTPPGGRPGKFKGSFTG